MLLICQVPLSHTPDAIPGVFYPLLHFVVSVGTWLDLTLYMHPIRSTRMSPESTYVSASGIYIEVLILDVIL